MAVKERRLHVRLAPLPGLPASAVLRTAGLPEALTVVNMSVGGMALVSSSAVRECKPGDRVSLKLDMGSFGTFDVDVVIRYHTSKEITGVQFADLAKDADTAVRTYVAELLERGSGG